MQKNERAEKYIADNILSLVKKLDIQKASNEVHFLINYLNDYQCANTVKYLSDLMTDIEGLSLDNCKKMQLPFNNYLGNYQRISSFSSQEELTNWMIDRITVVCHALKKEEKSRSQNLINRALQYIESSYENPCLSLETVASYLNTSVSNLSKLFNNYTGKTFPDYINALRLEKAKSLLLDKEERLSIAQISAMVGFSSNSYFASAFKKVYGVTPSKLRKMQEMK